MADPRDNEVGAGTGPESTRRSSRRERGIERTRQDILEAAGRAFARGGFHGTTMEAVAQEAGYAVGSLYTYFKGKEELYRSLVEGVGAELDAALDRPVPPSLDFRQHFELRLIRFFEVLEAKRELLAMYVAQRVSIDWELGSDLGEVNHRLHQVAVERWAAFLQRGIDEGLVRPVAEPRDMAPFVIGVVSATVMQWARTNPTGSLTAYASLLTQFIFDGLGQGPRSAEDGAAGRANHAGDSGEDR